MHIIYIHTFIKYYSTDYVKYFTFNYIWNKHTYIIPESANMWLRDNVLWINKNRSTCQIGESSRIWEEEKADDV